MKKLILAASVAALTIGTTAYARHHEQGDVTMAQAIEKAGERFEKMDANGDGVLNEADREARREQRFARLDSDGDGVISEAEYAAKPERRGQRAGADGHEGHEGMRGGKRGGRGGMMMKRADTDGDGSVSRAEFEAASQAMFTRADADGDGTVTSAERKAAREAMRNSMRERRAN